MPPFLPPSPEPHVDVWREYAHDAARLGAWEALRRRLPQLRFPVRAGTSQTEAYQAATRRGEAVTDAGDGLEMHFPDRLRIWIHDSLAGPIPVVCAGGREDFVLLVQALSDRNEPAPVPDSMGACLVSGYNNWDRIRRLLEQGPPEERAEELARIIPDKTLYQDRFLVLSEGPYSGVSAAEMGLPPEEWLRLSLRIRLAHECTHYLSLRLFGRVYDRPVDELIADYVGVAAAAGRYRADWALRFLGLEDSAKYREGGRLENYVGEPPLAEGAFEALQGLTRAAAANLECFDSRYFSGPRQGGDRMLVAPELFPATLEQLASGQADVYRLLPSRNSPTDVSA